MQSGFPEGPDETTMTRHLELVSADTQHGLYCAQGMPMSNYGSYKVVAPILIRWQDGSSP